MSKAFTKESDSEGDELDHAAEEAAQRPDRRSQELHHAERLAATQRRATVSAHQGTAGGDSRWWPGRRATAIAAKTPTISTANGGCVEIDRRIRFLTKRIDAAEVVDPEAPRAGRAATHVFFGATVRYANAAGTERLVSVVGVDEVDLDRNHISWMSPLARALMKSGPGDCVVLRAPGTTEQLQILEVRYERIAVKPFIEPPGAEAAPKTRPRTGDKTR